MNLPIRGRYEESGEYLAEAAKQVPTQRAVILVYVFAAVFSVVMAYLHYLTKQHGWFIFLFMLPIYYLVTLLMSSRWSFKLKYFASTGRNSTMVAIEFDDAGFKTQTDSGIKVA